MSAPFEDYLQALADGLPRRGRRRIQTEIRAHLEEAVESGRAAGIAEEEAARRAIERLGSAAELARSFAPPPAGGAARPRRLGAVPVSLCALGALLALAVALFGVSSTSRRAAVRVAAPGLLPIPDSPDPCPCFRAVPSFAGTLVLVPIHVDSGLAAAALGESVRGGTLTEPGGQPGRR